MRNLVREQKLTWDAVGITASAVWCAEHDQQLEGESPLPNRMEVNG
jgi:hypothetical protein